MFAGALYPSAPGGFPAAASGSFAAAGLFRLARAAAAGLVLALLSAVPQAQAQAQAQAQVKPQAEAAAPPAEVSQVTVTGVRPPASPCPAAASNGKPGLDCAAAKLDQAANAAQASVQQRPTGFILTARSPDVAVGVVNTTALAEQFGANLGKSVHPYRPTPPPQAPSSLSRRP